MSSNPQDSRARYQIFKARKICPHCKGPPEPGKVYCALYVREQYQRAKGRPGRREYMRRYIILYKQRQRLRVLAGLCVRCGREEYNARCPKCRARAEERAAAIPRPSIYELAGRRNNE